MNNISKEIKSELLEHIVPYYKSLIDKEYGGFYGDVTFDLEIKKESDKSSLSLSRYLYAFSRLFNSGLDRDSLMYATHAYEMLINNFYDNEYKGVFFLSDYKGNIINKRKQTYVQGFFIYALCEYYKATNNKTALKLALETFYIIEDKMYDQLHKGYLEEFTEDFQLIESELTSEHGVTAYFTTNTHLHLLEAYTNLYKVSQNRIVKEKLLLLLIQFEQYIQKKNSYQVFFDESFHSILDTISYGHDIETTWLIDETALLLNQKDYFTNQLLSVVNESKKYINQDHSQILEVVENKINENRVWWVQAEAMVGYLNAYQHTNDTTYYHLFVNLWEYIKKYMIDPREGSEWFWECDKNNLPIKRNITELWKTPYHNVRALIEVLERLKSVS